ncbi:MAG: holo-ACP synthase [Planctomycetes bacterium]|nr:holo-ACP synthase [Planctomycetota bacterium]
MIIGIGIDLVKIRRINKLIRSSSLPKIFTPNEIKYCKSKKNQAESFAARFAAKEAFLKAIGTGWGTSKSPHFSQIEVVRNNKSPFLSLKLTGKAREIAMKLKVNKIHLSVAHSGEYAIAVVILEGKSQ